MTIREISGVGTVHVGDTLSANAREQVREVQRGLNDLVGWSRVRTDGVMDAEVARVVEDFQASQGLPETGDIDHDTIRLLDQEITRLRAGRAAQEEIEAEATALIPGSATVQAAARTAVESVGRDRIDSSARAERTYGTTDQAETALRRDTARLFDVHRWDELSGGENAHFELFDREGHRVENRLAQEGDYVRIEVPGAPGDDWVRIERARVTDSAAMITVRPSMDPTDPAPRPDRIHHFFTAEATNTFSVERHGTTISARVDGRNERPNVGAQSEDLLRAARNRMIVEGAWGAQITLPGTHVVVGGMQQHQWNRFTANLVGDP